jgi:ribosomal protein S18 acetylase RimI-like enzyme
MSEASTPFMVRRASVEDGVALADLGARTFIETYAAENTAGDMAAYVASSFSPGRQARQLIDPAYRYLVAEAAGRLVGYLLLRTGEAPACVDGSMPVELARLYVERAWQGRGVAAALMAAGLSEAEGMGARTLWLGVWERNVRAIRFYERHGLRRVGFHTFQLGDDIQVDDVMARPVRAADLTG